MSAIELDEVIPGRSAEVVPAHDRQAPGGLHDPVDEGLGSAGTTIPLPLLGASSGKSHAANRRHPDLEPRFATVEWSRRRRHPSSRDRARTPARRPASRVRSRRATSRVLELIRSTRARDRTRRGRLRDDRAPRRDASTRRFPCDPRRRALAVLDPAHARRDPAGCAASRSAVDAARCQSARGCPIAARCTTTRSRTFLTSVLGACPPEILLVPVAVRERVVIVLFGEPAPALSLRRSTRARRPRRRHGARADPQGEALGARRA